MVLIRKYSVLVCLLLLSAVAFAWPIQTGASMSSCLQQGAMRSTSAMPVSATSTYRPAAGPYGRSGAVRTAAGMTMTIPSGRFTAQVASLDENGCAYAPGQTTSHPHGHIRRLNGEDSDNDNPDPMADPIGDTPWILFILLAIGYAAYKCRRTN